MLGRHTIDGRFEHEISANFVSKDFANKNLQRIKKLKSEPTSADLDENEMAIVEIVDGVQTYLKIGKTIYRQTWEKVG